MLPAKSSFQKESGEDVDNPCLPYRSAAMVLRKNGLCTSSFELLDWFTGAGRFFLHVHLGRLSGRVLILGRCPTWDAL